MAIIERHRDDVAIQGGELPEILLPTNCPGCGIGLAAPELRAHNYVCVNCGHHFRLGADVWVSLIADAESWQERWTDVRSHDLLNWTVPKRYQETVETLLEEGLNESVRTGTCTLAGKPIWLATFDFGFVGGTLSIVAGERLARGMEQAASSGVPYVLISASGGARWTRRACRSSPSSPIRHSAARLPRSRCWAISTSPSLARPSASPARG